MCQNMLHIITKYRTYEHKYNYIQRLWHQNSNNWEVIWFCCEEQRHNHNTPQVAVTAGVVPKTVQLLPTERKKGIWFSVGVTETSVFIGIYRITLKPLHAWIFNSTPSNALKAMFSTGYNAVFYLALTDFKYWYPNSGFMLSMICSLRLSHQL